MITLETMNQLADKVFNLKNYFCIPSFYDSHLHFEGIGKYSTKNNLSHIQSIEELDKHLSESSIDQEEYFEGFGLKTNLIQNLTLIFNSLKKHSNNKNLYLVIEDGHQLLFTGPTLNQYINGLTSDQKKTFPYFENLAIFNDDSRPQFDDFYFKSKKESNINSTKNIKTELLLNAQTTVLKNGITHFRDMTSDPEQLNTLLEIEKDNNLIVFPELFYSNFHGENTSLLIEKSIEGKLKCQNFKSKIRHKGIKIFLDGTFSQKTADTIGSDWKTCGCSSPGKNLKEEKAKNSTHNQATKEYLTQKDIQDLLSVASDANIEVAFHTIGDLAVEKVIYAFNNVKDKFKTQLHLEHCELINQKTLSVLKNLDPTSASKISFHFQPSHYLMDKEILNIIKSKHIDLCILDWSLLHNLGFKVFFGSDAPVTGLGLGYISELSNEPFFINQYAKAPFWSFFNHPDYKSAPNTFTVFKNLKVDQVFVLGRKIY